MAWGRVFAYHVAMAETYPGWWRRTPARTAFFTALCTALALVLGGSNASAQMARPLPPKDCEKVRQALENKLPFGPGFRRLTVKFPKNNYRVMGNVCHLLTLGTGAHMEGFGIRSLNDKRIKVRDALNADGWAETPETMRFNQKSSDGREVFGLFKDKTFCVTTIVVGVVEGATPAPGAVKDGKVMLAKLKPHQRE